jgi:murein DD-endopeptidase MepM/ murein hydrolase activator NlpD
VSVTEGDVVQAGQTLGLSGAEPDDYGSGPYTTGPHLHFDLVYDGAFVDPRPHFCGAPLKSDP